MFKNCIPRCFLILLTLTFTAIFSYLIARIYLVFTSALTPLDWVFALTLFFAECFIFIHSFGYFLNVFRVLKSSYSSPNPTSFKSVTEEVKLDSYPPVAIILASYKEPLHVLKDTLICFYNLSYPNKNLYLLDDTRYDLPFDTPENKLKYRQAIEDLCRSLDINLFRAKWHGAKAGIINDFVQHIHGNVREDFEFYPASKPREKEKYFIIFDADMNPFPDFVEPLVDIMEKKPRVAFVQTPQYYSNFEFNRVARTSGMQQAVFFEYICEGKGLQGAMFCCGTNVIYRIEAFDDVGGFDEISVTEDFSTSREFHKKGWESVYLNKISAFGMGPEDLGGFFSQQFRWSRGTLGVLMTFPKEFLLEYHKFTINQWWEYFLSSSHYFIGVIFFIMVLFPVTYLIFDQPKFITDPVIYLSTFLPYFILTISMFVTTLHKRHYHIRDIWLVLVINSVAFSVFIKAAIFAIFNIKTKFSVTPKDGSSILSLRSLWPQIFICLLCVFAIGWGSMRLYYEGEPFYALIVNMVWTFYNLLSVSFFLYFNHPQEEIVRK